jgi:hypothetical protein
MNAMLKGILRAIRALSIPFSIFKEAIIMIKLYPYWLKNS